MSSVLSSIKWNFSTSLLRRGITFVLFLVIANIFDRAQLGVYREFALIISFFTGISLFSTPTLYIVEKNNSILKKLAPAIFIITLLISVIMSFTAPLFGKHYNSDTLTTLLRYSVLFLLSEALRLYLRAVFQKQMDFKFLSIAETVNVIFYSALALIVIPFYQDIKVFIVIFYAGNLLELVLIIKKLDLNLINLFCRSLTKTLSILIESFKTLFDNISFLFFSSAATTINMLLLELPVLILGLYYAPEHIGNYFIAFQLVMVPSGLITMSLSQVFFSKFSQISSCEYKEKLDKLYDIEFNLLIPAFLIYALLIREWVVILFGTKDYAEIKWIVLLLFLRSMSAFIMNPISSFFAILKKPQIEFNWSVIVLIISNILVFFFRKQSFSFVLSVFIGSSVFLYLSFNWLVFRQISYCNRTFCKKLLMLFLKLIVISAIWFLFNSIFKQIVSNDYLLLSVQCCFAGLILIAYIATKQYVFKEPILEEIKKLLSFK
ncbi:MAG: oligosaccharide flippase family protein [Candidatus Cloacimonadales bacterium]|jgi:O-antigen/teichoic acid export membrane protein|nr:oligosaccharide flippase family protein [Candidatus Cloacimonadales bacterium]